MTSPPSLLPCPLCGAPSARRSAGTPFAYWQCRGCGTAHLHPPPSEAFLDAFYETFHAPGDGLFAGFEGRAAADFPAKARLVARRLSPGARVLDAGCGKGGFVAALRDRGLAAEGIDRSRTAVGEGTARGVAGLAAGRLEERTEWEGRFDAVTAWATIEHVPEPVAFLRAIRRVLKPGGLLFLDTGLAADAVERTAPGLVQWYDAPQHLFVFSRAGMERIVREAGFALVALDPHAERSGPRRAAKYLRNRFLAYGGGLLFRAGLGRAAFAQMRSEAKLPFGSLMRVVARREGP